jgi:N-acetylglucosaminyl-diphospho-decaprenol L-rhamnosyltransferase
MGGRRYNTKRSIRVRQKPENDAAEGSVAVITVSYNSGAVLDAFLDSIPPSRNAHTPIVIVNNSVADHTLSGIAAGHLSVAVYEAEENLGYGSAMNLGATLTSSEWLVIANPDIVLAPGAVDELLRVAATDERIGIVGPLILTQTGDVYPSARKLPSLRTGIGHALFARVWKTNPWTKSYRADRELPPRQRDAGWVSGACMFVRRSAYEQLGGFDEKYFMYFEDVDLCARAGRAGWRVVYAPSAKITHSGAHATSTSSKVMVRVHHRSAYVYLAARYSAWYLAPLRIALRVGLRARAALVRE